MLNVLVAIKKFGLCLEMMCLGASLSSVSDSNSRFEGSPWHIIMYFANSLLMSSSQLSFRCFLSCRLHNDFGLCMVKLVVKISGM